MSVAPGVCPNLARAASSGPVPARARTAAGRGDPSSSERFPPRVVKSRQTDRQFCSLPAPKPSADGTLTPIKLTVTLTELTEPGPTPNDERRMRPAESPAAEPNRQKRRAAKKSAPRPEKRQKSSKTPLNIIAVIQKIHGVTALIRIPSIPYVVRVVRETCRANLSSLPSY